MKVLILGHKGMLGHMVYKYLSTKDDCKILTINFRWPIEEFKKNILEFDGDYVVNCIANINQNKNNFEINTDLPIWLDSNVKDTCKVIHPGTDTKIGKYGISKQKAEDYILKYGSKTYIIKTSIIGSEHNSKKVCWNGF